MPLYFLKVKPIFEKYKEDKAEKDEADYYMLLKEDQKKQIEYAKANYRQDVSLTTSEKAMRMTPEQMERVIKKMERENRISVMKDQR